MSKTSELQVTGGLGLAGVETWFLQILKYIDRDKYQ